MASPRDVVRQRFGSETAGGGSPGTLDRALLLRRRLLEHPVYQRVRGAQAARVFMSYHVFAVFDFMSLLKALQAQLTSVTVPWVPPVDPRAARLVNEIVLAEESDEDGKGSYAGHYDIYFEAMRDVGADGTRIERFINALRIGCEIEKALRLAQVPEGAARFVRTTMDIAMNGKTHEVAAAFFYGREDIIPSMFDELRSSLERTDTQITERLRYYFSRHVELDGDLHGPAAERLLRSLCGTDAALWREAEEAACRALKARTDLWDAVVEDLDRLGV